MKKEIAYIEYKETEFLKYVVERYNHSHRKSTRSCELQINNDGNHKITIVDEAELMPYGIFDIGTQIGFVEMNSNFRIKVKALVKNYFEVIFESDNYPTFETFRVEIDEDEIVTIPIRNSVGINSSIGNLKPYLTKEDFITIYEKSNFQIVRSSTVHTQKNKRINYYIQDNYLFLFGIDIRYSPNYYQIELESVYEIQIPEDDF